jgi:predicted Ser/Thr protein kinase
MAEQPTCPRCGARLTRDESASGACPRCLLRAGMQSSASAPRRAPPPSLTELAPHFPRLELLELVGEGGMGAVYKARDLQLGRLIALKILLVDASGEARWSERFAREARAMARLAHPNIAAVYEHGAAGPWSYLAMEYVDGANLRAILRSRAVEPAEALRWVSEICAALQYAHERGVVHRDIKPENVLIDAQGRVKVVDFGLAKLLDRRPGEATLTQSQESMGTWHYMAPEQYERPQTVDHRADIYSLGVVFYELLTGQVPVGRFDPPSQRVSIDVRLDEVVLRALAREPAKRWQAAGDVQAQVDGLGAERGLRGRLGELFADRLQLGMFVGIAGFVVLGTFFACVAGLLTWVLVADAEATGARFQAPAALKWAVTAGPPLAGLLAALGFRSLRKGGPRSRRVANVLFVVAALMFVISLLALLFL